MLNLQTQTIKRFMIERNGTSLEFSLAKPIMEGGAETLDITVEDANREGGRLTLKFESTSERFDLQRLLNVVGRAVTEGYMEPGPFDDGTGILP